MSRLKFSILLIVLLPLVSVVSLYFLAKSLQPTDLSLASDDEYFQTTYLDESKFYCLRGETGCIPGSLLMPTNYNLMSSKSGQYYSTLSKTVRTLPDYCTITSMEEIKSEKYEVGGSYMATLCFFLKLPSNASYAIWFPADFCEYNVYVNGSLAAASDTFRSKHPHIANAFYVPLPASSTGTYEIIVNVIAPSDFPFVRSGAVLIGSLKKIELSFMHIRIVSLFFLSFITFTMLFTIVQIIAIRNDLRLLAFSIMSFFTMLAMSFMDGRMFATYFPQTPYKLGCMLEYLAPPLFILSLVFFSYSMYKDIYPKNHLIYVSVFLIVPVVNAFLLNRYTWLSIAASAVNVIPFAICLYVFVVAYSKDLPHALPYGIGVMAIEISLLLYYSTRDMAVPSRFAYVIGYLIFAITIVTILAHEYATQYTSEYKLSSELSKQLEAMQASENAFLNAQMKPHFLYNTLNTIADCCVTDSKKAQQLINSLSEYLKLVLSLDNMDKTVPLRRELELASAYTAIEKQRFPSINFYKDFPIKLPKIMMPPLIIQPLIENAIKHGVRKSDKPGVVTLRIVENEDSVDFFVSDNGKGMDEEAIGKLFHVPKDNQSIGIYNIDKRLKNLYGEGLKVESTPGLGTCVSFRVLKNVN